MKYTLFDNKKRTDDRPSYYSEGFFDYLDISGRKSSKRVRDILDSWFLKLSLDKQREYHPLLRGNEKSAFFEIYLYMLFKKLSFNVVFHPPLQNTDRCPDFLISNSIGHKFILEAANAQMSEDADRKRKRNNELYDILNKVNSPDFFLYVEVLNTLKHIPAKRKIIHYVKENLHRLKYEDLIEKCNNNRELGEECEQIIDGWHIRFIFTPKPPEIRGELGIRPLGGIMEFTSNIDVRDRIMKKITLVQNSFSHSGMK